MKYVEDAAPVDTDRIHRPEHGGLIVDKSEIVPTPHVPVKIDN